MPTLTLTFWPPAMFVSLSCLGPKFGTLQHFKSSHKNHLFKASFQFFLSKFILIYCTVLLSAFDHFMLISADYVMNCVTNGLFFGCRVCPQPKPTPPYRKGVLFLHDYFMKRLSSGLDKMNSQCYWLPRAEEMDQILDSHWLPKQQDSALLSARDCPLKSRKKHFRSQPCRN